MRVIVPWLLPIVLLVSCGRAHPPDLAPLRVDVVAAGDDAPMRRIVLETTGKGLLGFNGRGEVVPQLASSWRIIDGGRSVIFRLRAGGPHPVAASAIVVAFRRLAQARSPGDGRALVAMLANGDAVLDRSLPPTALGIDAPVAGVVEVRAAGVLPGLLQVVAQPEMSVETGSAGGPAGSLHVAGPRRQPLLLQRGTASPVSLAGAADAGGAIARFVHDRTDLVIAAGLEGFDDARVLAASNALRAEPAWGVYGYLIRFAGPLADVRVRRALAMAIGRDDLGSRLFGIALTPVEGLVPPLPSEPAPVRPDWAAQAPAARRDLARQLLAAAGFGPARPLTVTMSIAEGREHADVAAEVASDWQSIGVQTRTVTRSRAAHAQIVARGDYELALVERTSPLDTPLAFLLPLSCRSGSYCNPGADALVTAARTSPDAKAAATTLASAEAAMVADTPMIPLFATIRWALVSPRIHGWYPNPGGHHPLALLTIDPPARPLR